MRNIFKYIFCVIQKIDLKIVYKMFKYKDLYNKIFFYFLLTLKLKPGSSPERAPSLGRCPQSPQPVRLPCMSLLRIKVE